jgi:hypothetical protein
VSEGFDADWLALREPFDAAARSTALAAALIATLPARPKLLDLGAGTGALFRWLAPRIGRAQAWTLFDADRDLLDEAFDTIADWAEDFGWPVTTPGRAMLVHAPGGAWRIEARVGDLAAVSALPLAGHDAVVNTALCDLVSRHWAQAIAARLKVPFHAALMVDGRVDWRPRHVFDRPVAMAFRRDQARDKGLGLALGHRAPLVLAETFAAAGFRVLTAPSDWRIGPASIGMLAAMARGDADAAVNARPMLASQVEAWRADRLHAAARRRASLRLGHRDLLAIPS